MGRTARSLLLLIVRMFYLHPSHLPRCCLHAPNTTVNKIDKRTKQGEGEGKEIEPPAWGNLSEQLRAKHKREMAQRTPETGALEDAARVGSGQVSTKCGSPNFFPMRTASKTQACTIPSQRNILVSCPSRLTLLAQHAKTTPAKRIKNEAQT